LSYAESYIRKINL